MPRRSFRIGRSFTGLGLFANRPIKTREKIAEYKGPRVDAEEAGRLERRGNRYLYEINPRVTIDGTPRSNLARYANHSCNPNAESYTYGGRVFIRAMRNIKTDEEITYDYLLHPIPASPWDFMCECKSDGCVKWVKAIKY